MFNIPLAGYQDFNISQDRKDRSVAALTPKNGIEIEIDIESLTSAERLEIRRSVVHMGPLDRFCDWAFHHGAKKEALNKFADVLLAETPLERENAALWLLKNATSEGLKCLIDKDRTDNYSVTFSQDVPVLGNRQVKIAGEMLGFLINTDDQYAASLFATLSKEHPDTATQNLNSLAQIYPDAASLLVKSMVQIDRGTTTELLNSLVKSFPVTASRLSASIQQTSSENAAKSIASSSDVTNLFTTTNTENNIASSEEPILTQEHIGQSSSSRVSNQETIGLIANNLTDNAKILFSNIITPPTIGECHKNSPLVLGDLDGSSGRLILTGIQSGHIEPSEAGIRLLSELLNAEAEASVSLEMLKFQANKEYQEKFELLFQELTFNCSEQPIIVMGDVDHDRLSCNKDINREIVKKLHENGGVFIRGNHDYPQIIGALLSGQSGEVAFDSFNGDIDKWSEYADKVYVNAYYDSNNDNFYIHHGLFVRDNVLHTVFASFPLDMGELNNPGKRKEYLGQLAKDINKVQTSEVNMRTIHVFRPSDTNSNEAGKILNARIVHGHNGIVNTADYSHTANLNARTSNNNGGQLFQPAACIVGSFVGS